MRVFTQHARNNESVSGVELAGQWTVGYARVKLSDSVVVCDRWVGDHSERRIAGTQPVTGTHDQSDRDASIKQCGGSGLNDRCKYVQSDVQ